MQWLIDIVLEKVAEVGYALQSWVQAQGYLTTSFVDRGDPAVPDFSELDFIKDGAWHDLDLSSIIPENAKAAAFSLYLMSPTVQSGAWFRKNGNTHGVNASNIYTQVSNIYIGSDIIVPLDESRIIEYLFHPVAWVEIFLIVKGWWF